MPDEDELRKLPDEEDLGELDSDDLDDDLMIADITKKKSKRHEDEDDSLEALAEEDDSVLPEDAFDDVEPEDMW